VLCWCIWMVASFAAWDPETSPGIMVVNSDPDTGSLAGVVGTILFNFGFVTTVPSWINEKKENVNVNKSLWGSTTICVVIYLVIGIPGAVVFSDVLQGPVTATCAANVADPSFNCPNDLMQTLTQRGEHSMAPWQDSSFLTFVLQASVFMFPIVAVVSSIPVFSIVIKYNLVENGFSPFLGFMWGVIFPWVVAFPLLYMPNLLAQFVNFTSLVFVSFTDFIVPFSLYVVLQRRQQKSLRTTGQLHLGGTSPGSKHEKLITDAENNPLSPEATKSDTQVLAVCPNSPDAQDWDAESLEPHQALSAACGGQNPHFKTYISIILGTLLTALSVAGTYLTIVQGAYQLDAQTCALVGN